MDMDHAADGTAGVGDLAGGLRGWLVGGAPQSQSGAFYAWLERDGRRPSFEYPEITGYALTHLAGLADPSEAEVSAGHRAGEWLLDRFSRQDLSAHQGYDDEAVYTFDLAMIATGLMTFGARHDVSAFVEQGLALAADMRAEIEDKGRLDSIAPTSRVSTSRSAWSTEGSAHILKPVQCLLLGDAMGEPGFARAARTLATHCVQAQEPDGRFATHPSDRETMLHPHLYAVEGLWMLAEALDDDDARERARRGASWAWDQQLSSGGFPRYVSSVGEGPAPEQMDLTAQAVRAALLTGLPSDGMPAALARLVSVAIEDGGGLVLPYQPAAAVQHLNVWATLFGAQAAALGASSAPQLDWRFLV